jgi:hypothetical protein
MNDTVELWEQSGLLEGFSESHRVACVGKMEAMKRFLLSPGYSSLDVEGLVVKPEITMFPIVRRMFVKEQEYEAAAIVKDFISFCKEKQDKPPYKNAIDPELDLTFDFCKEYTE